MPGTNAKGNWEILPYEMLYKIFSYLSTEEIVLSVQHVCRRWLEVSRDARLWKTLQYVPSQEVCFEDVRHFLEQAPYLRYFSLSYHNEADRIVEMLPDYCQQLEMLKLQYSRHACSSQELLARLLFCLENIKHLEISLNEIDEALLGSFWLAQNLQSLSLTFRTFSSSVHKLLSHVMQNCYSLQELGISFQCDVFNSDLKALLQKVKRLLTQFAYLSGDGFTEETIGMFSQCVSLKCLTINRSKVYTNVLNLKCIGKLPPLEDFAVMCTNVSPDSLTHLFLSNSWDKLVKLRFVGLKGFDNETLFHVSRACANLEELHLLDSSITDKGFQYMCDYGSRLKRVFVDRTGLTDAGLQNLHQCSCLEVLSLKDCPNLTGDAAFLIIMCTQLTDINVGGNSWVTNETVETLLQCPRLQYLRVEFCCNVTTACFENVKVPQNFHYVKVTCKDKIGLANLMEVATRKPFVRISSWCYSLLFLLILPTAFSHSKFQSVQDS